MQEQAIVVAADGFEQVFIFTERGQLRASRDILRNVELWWNTNRILITLITGVRTQPIRFKHQGQGDIGSMHDNKMLLLHVYALAYSAYLRFCQTIDRRVANEHLVPQLTEGDILLE